MLPAPRPIDERHGLDPRRLPDDVLQSTAPLLLRGLAAHWPAVAAARSSMHDAIGYLRRFTNPDAPRAVATVAAAETGGRFFYGEDVRSFNFRQEQVPLEVVLATLRKYLDDPAPPAIYVASTTLDIWLPGFRAENDLDLGDRDALASIWIGNRTRIAAHQDVPDNIACVVAGRRRVTLFPPEQLQNLYIGPLDYTPAGQAISLVDFHAPDLARFPRFAEAWQHAQVAELDPGDAVFIPSLWWHHMEGLEAFNVLVNYWWRRTPAWMDTPMNALMLAIMSMRDLPSVQRAQWQEIFRHYVFEAGELTAAHIPEGARGALGPMDEARAAAVRDRLLQRLKPRGQT